jgi:small subunit ribosomal protein S16
MGRKKQAHYRVVVADSASPRDGRFVETLGYYKPLSHPARLVLDLERVDHWLGAGAQPSGTMKSLIAKARRGGDAKVALGEVDAEARKASRVEQLAARRATEQKAEADAKAATDAAEAEAASEAEAAPEAEAEEAPAAEATDDAGDEPAAEAEGETASDLGAEVGADAEAEEADDGEKSE